MRFIPLILISISTLASKIGTTSGQECPESNRIKPCKCQEHPHVQVTCSGPGIDTFDTIRKAIGHRFHKPIPILKFANLASFALPENAFKDIRAKQIIVEESTIEFQIGCFGGVDSIENLYLKSDHLTFFPTGALLNMPAIRTLRLEGNALTNLQEGDFHGLDRVKALMLNENQIKRIKPGSLPYNIQHLEISRNAITSLAGSLKFLYGLEYLDVSYNKLTTVRNELEHLHRLLHLDLSHNSIADLANSFDFLNNLENLDLSNNHVVALQETLSPLKTLKKLDLSNNRIREIDENNFKSLVHLQELSLSYNRIQNLGDVLKSLKELQILDVSHNDLKTLQPHVLRNTLKLKRVDLSYNSLTALNWETGYSWSQLTELRLSNNKLNTLSGSIRDFVGLEVLDLSSNEIAELDPWQFERNKVLKRIILEGNPIECTVSTEAALKAMQDQQIQVNGMPTCYNG